MSTPSSYDAPSEYPSSPSSTTIITDVSSDSSGLGTSGKITIAVVVILTCLVWGFILLLYCGNRHAERISKAKYFRAKAIEPDLTYRLWKERHEWAALTEEANKRAREELEEANREFAVHREREERRMGGGKKKSSFASKVVVSFFMKKKTEAPTAETVCMGLVQPGASVTSTPAPASAAREPGATVGSKTPFQTQDRKGKGKETKGENRKRKSFFSTFRTVLKADAVAGQRGRGVDEESLVGGQGQSMERLGVEGREPARRNTWGSEAPPAYESLLAEDQQHGNNPHSDMGR